MYLKETERQNWRYFLMIASAMIWYNAVGLCRQCQNVTRHVLLNDFFKHNKIQIRMIINKKYITREVKQIY